MISGAGRTPSSLLRRPVLKASKTRTGWPCAVKSTTRSEPIEPAPPVTRHNSLMKLVYDVSIREQGLDIGFRVERLQVFELFADADETHWQSELLLDREDRAALGSAVELGEDDARAVDRLL